MKVSEELDLPPADFGPLLDRASSLSEPISHDLHPERHFNIRELIVKAQEDWVLPKFQRYYDWGKKDIIDLLESIFYDYYIGSLLIWQITGSPELETIRIKGVENDSGRITDIILDGQQRITSLYYAIKTPEFALKGDRDQVFFYIDFNSHITGKPTDSVIKVLNNRYTDQETFELMLFPFYRIERYGDWVDQCEDYLIYEKKFDFHQVRKLRTFLSSAP